MDWSFRRNFLWVSSPSLHTLSREKFASSSHKYSECFLNFSTRSSLIRHLRQPLHHDPAAFSRVILGGKCAQAGIEQDRFGLVENTVPLWQHTKISETQTGIFGEMERAQNLGFSSPRI